MSIVIAHVRQGDTDPLISVVALRPDKTVEDCTAATSVTFTMIHRQTLVRKVDAQPATVVGTPSAGVLAYQLKTVDLDTPGTYRAYFRVTFPGPRTLSFPNDESVQELRVHIVAQ